MNFNVDKSSIILNKKIKDDTYLVKYNENTIYIGEIIDGKYNGYGKYFSKHIIAHGEFKDDKLNGNGVLIVNNKYFNGNFIDNKLTGKVMKKKIIMNILENLKMGVKMDLEDYM